MLTKANLDSGNLTKPVNLVLPFSKPSGMSAVTQSRSLFKGRPWLACSRQEASQDDEASKKEIERFVMTTLGVMTAGCEQCVYSQRLFCEKLKRPIKVHDTRCEFFTRRPSFSLKDLI
jgi:hypothetical protein